MRTALTRLALLPLALLLAVSGCETEGPTYSNQIVSVRYVSWAEFGQVGMTLLVADSGEASVVVEFGERDGTPAPPAERRMGTLQPADLVRLKQAAVEADLATLEGPFDCAHYKGCSADGPTGTLEITVDGVTSSVFIDRNIPDDKLPDRLRAMLDQLTVVQRALPR
ncbi:MAG: hypothetical protein IT370_13945 [Deltaproteobacteria bacterium]|nr:hypothetical protein [Deltaproteobacteria bacterium]